MSRILIRTVAQVLGRRGVLAVQDPTAIEFPARFQAGLAETRLAVPATTPRAERTQDGTTEGTVAKA